MIVLCSGVLLSQNFQRQHNVLCVCTTIQNQNWWYQRSE